MRSRDSAVRRLPAAPLVQPRLAPAEQASGLALDLGKRTVPVITPDDPEQVVALFRRHGIVVTRD
jgi:hypothetical protein